MQMQESETGKRSDTPSESFLIPAQPLTWSHRRAGRSPPPSLSICCRICGSTSALTECVRTVVQTWC